MTAILAGSAAVLFGLPILRRHLVTRFLMRAVAPFLPRLGDTERIALEAGTVWWDRDLFSGDPDWRKLLDFQAKPLTEKERAFLEGPVEELCGMVDDWEVSKTGDLGPEVWEFLKKHRFLGMIIPEEYGGLGFSAQAHSLVVTKISSRSLVAGVTVMVPNSLGPAELLHHYGTKEQKDYYLPRLATAEEVPCFALTEPEAGSDAASPRSTGIVCRGNYRGKEVLGMRLNWDKRYTTLAPVATVIGLAFRLLDPDRVLGDKKDRGINCALIPADVPGVEIGERHDPLGVPFQIGPTRGHDVFVPLDFLIGGPERIGQGDRPPGLAVAGAELSTRVAGAYATVREQFNMPIGRFEGIEEPLARIGGMTYLMNAARKLTAAAVDAGERPAVISAIVKAYLTEGMRDVVNDAMDIRAGAGIIRGPRNILSRAYQAIPIGITVEGANILTRTMIIFGQGAIRSHPYVQDEIRAVEEKDLKRFDRAFFGHVGSVFRNAVRSMLLGLTFGRLYRAPVEGKLSSFFGRFSRMSAAFALVSDTAMVTLGGDLKRREKLSGRLADVLAWLYLGSSTMKRFVDEGQKECDLPYARWACAHALYKIQVALAGVLDNLENRVAAWILLPFIFPIGDRLRPPSDALGAEVARGLLEDREARLRLTTEIYLPPFHEPGLGRLEAALDRIVEARPVEKKIHQAVRAGKLKKADRKSLIAQAAAAGVITADEQQRIQAADEIRLEVIQVDSFAAKKAPALQ
ncbi:MAG: acyl-CoA dehydrogenase [Acidobacteria bacterium]|nr:acyl-CoA dehydrogenase [Acidobacteriota bacterium]